MSSDASQTPAMVLITSAVKTVGKREFLKTVEQIFGLKGAKDVKQPRKKTDVPADKQCLARVKGERTGIKVGRYVLFEAVRCPRHEAEDHLCPIHCNQVKKFGKLMFGAHADTLTDEQKKVFGEL